MGVTKACCCCFNETYEFEEKWIPAFAYMLYCTPSIFLKQISNVSMRIIFNSSLMWFIQYLRYEKIRLRIGTEGRVSIWQLLVLVLVSERCIGNATAPTNADDAVLFSLGAYIAIMLCPFCSQIFGDCQNSISRLRRLDTTHVPFWSTRCS